MNKIKTSLGIPLYVIHKDDDISKIKDGMAYIVGKDGLFLKKTNKLYTSITQVKEVECLGEVKPTAEVKFTKMSHDMFQAIETFFADIYETFKSEVAILLYYSFDKKEWGWLVPDQKVGGASVDYEIDDKAKFVKEDGTLSDTVPEGFAQMGSIHSHASMSAFHSGTDDKDEFHFDGLHITIGSFSSHSRTYSSRWMISGIEIKSDIPKVVEGVQDVGKYPATLKELVKKPTVVVHQAGYSKGYSHQNSYSPSKHQGANVGTKSSRIGFKPTPTIPKSVVGGAVTSGANVPDDNEVIDADEKGIIMHEA